MKNNIKNIRCQKKLSLCRISESTGICFERLKAIEESKCHDITVNEWYTIAEAMDTTIADLLDLPVLTVNERDDERKQKNDY